MSEGVVSYSSSLCSVCESLEFQFMSEVVVLCTQNTVFCV